MDEVRREDRLTTADIAGARTEGRARPERAAEPGRLPATPIRVEREDERPTPLFAPDQAEQLRNRWMQIQTSFVDAPRGAVEEADGLVADAIQRLAQSFAGERQQLESQWGRGSDVSTEDLRQALRRYRSFFDRLLSV